MKQLSAKEEWKFSEQIEDTLLLNWEKRALSLNPQGKKLSAYAIENAYYKGLRDSVYAIRSERNRLIALLDEELG